MTKRALLDSRVYLENSITSWVGRDAVQSCSWEHGSPPSITDQAIAKNWSRVELFPPDSEVHLDLSQATRTMYSTRPYQNVATGACTQGWCWRAQMSVLMLGSEIKVQSIRVCAL